MSSWKGIIASIAGIFDSILDPEKKKQRRLITLHDIEKKLLNSKHLYEHLIKSEKDEDKKKRLYDNLVDCIHQLSGVREEIYNLTK